MDMPKADQPAGKAEVVEEVVVEVPEIVEDVEDNELELELERDDEDEDDSIDPVYLNIVIVIRAISAARRRASSRRRHGQAVPAPTSVPRFQPRYLHTDDVAAIRDFRVSNPTKAAWQPFRVNPLGVKQDLLALLLKLPRFIKTLEDVLKMG
ncbi:hypothetical protein FRC04_006610 [Tulasnella sp. 424]|nr:hypothetical protein FRC04_006610 [Tulasnella sp. 424]